VIILFAFYAAIFCRGAAASAQNLKSIRDTLYYGKPTGDRFAMLVGTAYPFHIGQLR